MTSRVRSVQSRLDDVRASAAARGIDVYACDRFAWLVLSDPTPDRGTLVEILWGREDVGRAEQALTDHPGWVVEIWPAADVAEIEMGERVWRRS